MVGEEQTLEASKQRQFSIVEDSANLTDRLGVDEPEPLQAERCHLPESRCVQLHKRNVVRYEHVECLQIGQRQSSVSLICVAGQIDVQLFEPMTFGSMADDWPI